jgi:hypothetical protein
MIEQADNSLDLWREEGCQSIQKNFEVFCNLFSRAKDLAHRGQYNAAAVYAQIAAFHAQNKHCGFFTSLELEQILLVIGQQTLSKTSHFHQKHSSEDSLPENPKKILHVASSVTNPFSGIPRLIQRWIQQDTERRIHWH